jgi:uncharacterized membrane protein YjdF
MPREQRPILTVLFCGFAIVLIWSTIHPHDYFTWALEIFPAILGLAALAINLSQVSIHVICISAYHAPCVHFIYWRTLHLCGGATV